MGLNIIPFALSNVTEAIFQAQEKMHLIAFSTVPIYILRLLVIIWAINQKYGVGHIAGILVISETIILIIEWCLLVQIIKPKWQIKQDFIWKTIKNSRTFFAIEATGIIASRMQILTLSLLGSEILVGIYGAIEQLMQPYYIVCNSILLAAFPKMSKAVHLGKEKQRQLVEGILEALICIALPLIIGILFFGKDLVNFVYKDPTFNQAVLPLQLVALTLVTFTLGRTCGYVLLSNNYEKFNLIEVIVTTVLGGFVGIYFISIYGLLGAAYMAIVMSLTASGVLGYGVYSRIFSFRLWKIMIRPIVISILMLPVFIILRNSNLSFFATFVTNTCVYIFIVGCQGAYLFRDKLLILKQKFIK
jgi:O-antigen/teichoic acid export membrane protein